MVSTFSYFLRWFLASSLVSSHTPLPKLQHISYALEILLGKRLSQLILGEPLEIRQLMLVALEIGLTSHDSPLEEEDLLPRCLLGFRILGWDWLVDDVRNRDAAHNPRVHVDAGRLGEDTGSSLDSPMKLATILLPLNFDLKHNIPHEAPPQ